jgi:hypothetical protein
MKRSEMNHELIAQQHCGSIMAAVKNGLSADFLIRIVDGQVAASKASNMKIRTAGRPRLSFAGKHGMTLDFTDDAQIKLLWTILNVWPIEKVEASETSLDKYSLKQFVTSMELVRLLQENGYKMMSAQSLAKLLRDNTVIAKASGEKQIGIRPKGFRPRSYDYSDFKCLFILMMTDESWVEVHKQYQAEHPERAFPDGWVVAPNEWAVKDELMAIGWHRKCGD